jgi:RNA recognition motif-containing protein
MKIFAGNLSPTTTEAELRAAFAAHGAVESTRLVTDKDTGKLKGFGFVEMTNDDEGVTAVTALHGTELGGSVIKVNEAKPRPQNAEASANSGSASKA